MLVEIVRIRIGCSLYLVSGLVYNFKGLSMESLVFFVAEHIKSFQMGLQELQRVSLLGLFDLFFGPIARVIIVARVRQIALDVCLDEDPRALDSYRLVDPDAGSPLTRRRAPT